MYPLWARRQEVEAEVTLRFLVNEKGKVVDIEVEKVLGDSRFADVARRAVARWVFSPARYRSRPIAVWCVQRIEFKLTD